MLAEPFFSFPRLTVVEQNSLSETTFTRNGKEETLHIVVKNSPFVIGLRLDNDLVPPSSHFRDLLQPYLRASTAATAGGGKGGSSSAAHHDPLADRVDLGRVTFDCALLYDSEDPFATPESEVDYVSKKPFHFKVEVVEDGRRANLEVRLKVLSSQHEDMFFRVKFIALDPLTKQQIAPSFVAFSAPIKVISKPEQLKKRKPSKKKTLNDFLIETLTRIEKQQNDQQKLLDVLSHQQSPPQFSASSSSSSSTPITLASFGAGSSLPSSSSPSSSSSQLSTTTTSTSGTSHDHNVDDDGSLTEQQRHLLSLLASSSSPQQQENSDEDDDSDSTNGADFEAALTNLLHKYNALPDTEKSEQIQQLKHLLQFTQANVRENLFELNDLLQAEEEEASAPSAAASGFSFVDMMTMVSGNDEEGEGDEHSRGRGEGEEPSQGGEHGEDCGCEMCPYKVELQRIETFYKDVFQL